MNVVSLKDDQRRGAMRASKMVATRLFVSASLDFNWEKYLLNLVGKNDSSIVSSCAFSIEVEVGISKQEPGKLSTSTCHAHYSVPVFSTADTDFADNDRPPRQTLLLQLRNF